MPSMDGPDLVAECRRRWPALSVIIFTTFDDATIIRRSLTAGAAGFLLKDISSTSLTEVIAIAHDGRTYVNTRVAHLLTEPSWFAGLTPTEKSVAELERAVSYHVGEC